MHMLVCTNTLMFCILTTYAISREKLDNFLEECMDNGLIADGVVAQDSQQFTYFWRLREVSNVLF